MNKSVFIKGVGMVRVIEENRKLLKHFGKEDLLPVLPGKNEIKKADDTDIKKSSKSNNRNGNRANNK